MSEQRITDNQEIDEQINTTDKLIYDTIEKNLDEDRGFLSQSILKNIRTLIEHIAMKIYARDKNISNLEDKYENIVAAKTYIGNKGEYRDIWKFHEFIQGAVGHRTPTGENAERLMLKYYEYLIKLKLFYKTNFSIDILTNINKFPLNTDESYQQYYGKIAEKLDEINYSLRKPMDDGRFYVQRVKPFFINEKIYYEVTLAPAKGNISKFDRITMYTKFDMDTSYAVKVKTLKKNVEIFDSDTEIRIISQWEISIRPCEINNFCKLLDLKVNIQSNHSEYRIIMSELTKYNRNLLDYIEMTDEYFDYIKASLKKIIKTTYIFDMLEKCKTIIKNNENGSNILRYLIYKFNNTIIKDQLVKEYNSKLSFLKLSYGCIPFDEMPYATSLINHNPRIYDLFQSIPVNNREHELLARHLQINTVEEGNLYTPIEELEKYGNVDELIRKYNSKLYLPRHNYRVIKKQKNLVYISGFETSSIQILNKINELTTSGIKGYSDSIKYWLKTDNYEIDDPNKKSIIEKMFENSRVALIYGAAGTGKSTMIKHISTYYKDSNKLLIANTHPAVENLKRRINVSNSKFSTIKSIISSRERECDLLIIDECSTVSNEDMLKILSKVNYKLLILVGDIYQIEAISFGNWFGIAKIAVEKKAIYQLEKPFRSKNDKLIELWDKVRNVEEDIEETLVRYNISQKLNSDILRKESEDEIILCLNYDGLYGINNINRFMQNNNPNSAFDWGMGTYKIGDPILFDDSERFFPIIYNNLKGIIDNIEIEDNKIWFNIKIDVVINEIDAENAGLILVDTAENYSIVRFSVNRFKDLDEDDDMKSDTIVPFVIAYAVSIHKSQGLEYNSVKIIINQEVEEKISHNIFYTSITRAMDKLKIYWTPETENSVISKLKQRFNGRDACIIRSKLS